jgi:hypothetical protein
MIWIPKSEIETVSSQYPHTSIDFLSSAGKKTSWKASVLYQNIVKASLHEDSDSFALFGDTILTAENLKHLSRTDLEVVYIGRAFGDNGGRNAIDRLRRHEKLQEIYSHIINRDPSLELWILLLPLAPSTDLNILAPEKESKDHEIEEWIHRSQESPEIGLENRINFTEAALINYFKPKYNKLNMETAFPSRKHVSYERWFVAPVDFVALEVQTYESLGCRLFSSAVPPSFLHIKNFQVNKAVDRKRFTDFLI